MKQLEEKYKSYNKRISKLENTVRDLTNKLNEMTQNEHQDEIKDKEDSDVASVSSVTSNNHSLLFVGEPYRPMLPFTAPEDASTNHPNINLTRYKTPTNRYQPLVNIKSQHQNIPATNPNPLEDHSPPQSFQNMISNRGGKSRHPKIISPPLLAQVKSSQQNLSDEIHVSAEIVILLDSNGRHLRTNEIFPKFSATKIGCPLIEQANEAILDKKFISNPKAFIIHTGTNYLEKEDPASVADRLTLLLPRSNNHSKKVMECNNIIKRHSSVVKNIELLDHIISSRWLTRFYGTENIYIRNMEYHSLQTSD